MSARNVDLCQDEFTKAVYELMFTPKWRVLRCWTLKRQQTIWYKAMSHIINNEM